MAEQDTYNSLNELAMSRGHGAQSYANNSSIQRRVIDAAKSLIRSSISENFMPTALKTFCIADLGCSVVLNTLIAVENVIEAVKLKYQNTDNELVTPEFHVHFNDYSTNDFNALFKSLPPDREYYASGVPGSFYTRLFPRESLNFVHSSNSLHWLSRVPKEITDRNSRAWNKGRIFHVGAGEEVINAFSRRFATDFNEFLEARAAEIVPGGLVVLLLPARPNRLPHSRLPGNVWFDTLGACLMDLARQGVIDEEKVDAFNLPAYFPSPEEIEKVIKQNGCFSIERVENLPQVFDPSNPPSPENVSMMIRGITEELIRDHLGHQILDQVFGLFPEKLIDAAVDLKSSSTLTLFILLKLKIDTAIN